MYHIEASMCISSVLQCFDAIDGASL